MENDIGSFLPPEGPLYDKGEDLACVCSPQDEGLSAHPCLLFGSVFLKPYKKFSW